MEDQPETVVNFQGVDGLVTYVLDAQLVDSNGFRKFHWSEFHAMHIDSIIDDVPADDRARVYSLLNADNTEQYAETRVQPNKARGHGMREHQLFSEPTVSVVANQGSALAVAVSARNTSARDKTPKLLKPLEYTAKMYVPKRIHIPGVSDKIYVALREAYSRKHAQPEMEVDEGLVVVSGLTVLALYYSLLYRDQDEKLSVYLDEKDPADTDMVNLANAIQPTSRIETPGGLPGYIGDTTVREEKPVGEVLETIKSLPGAEDAIAKTTSHRITKKMDRQEKRDRIMHRRTQRERQEFQSRLHRNAEKRQT